MRSSWHARHRNPHRATLSTRSVHSGGAPRGARGHIVGGVLGHGIFRRGEGARGARRFRGAPDLVQRGRDLGDAQAQSRRQDVHLYARHQAPRRVPSRSGCPQIQRETNLVKTEADTRTAEEYRPPAQSRMGQWIDAGVLLLLVFGALYAPVLLGWTSSEARAQAVTHPTWESLHQNPTMAAQWQK